MVFEAHAGFAAGRGWKVLVDFQSLGTGVTATWNKVIILHNGD